VRRAALVLIALTLVGCGAPSLAPGSPDGETAGATRQVTADDCGPIELRTPAGASIDLTGTWAGASAQLFVHQYGDCVWIEEFSADPREDLGESYRRVFFGRLGSDFTIVGRFADIFSKGSPVLFGFEIPPEGGTDFRVIIRQEGGAEVVVLEGHARESTEAGFFPAVEYTRIAPGTALPSS
jgi:hypothetical protein